MHDHLTMCSKVLLRVDAIQSDDILEFPFRNPNRRPFWRNYRGRSGTSTLIGSATPHDTLGFLIGRR